MNIAEWIIVVILSVTLFIFLIVGIILMLKVFGLVDEAKKMIAKGQDIADKANGVVSNVKGMTSIGGAVEKLVDKYINQKLKDEPKKEKKEDGEGKDGKK